MHGFVHAQAFHVRPFEYDHLLSRYLFGVEQGDELYELRIAGRLDALDQFRKRETDPWNHHRPPFHATHAVDALFQWYQTQHFIYVVVLRFLDLAFDFDLPGTGLEFASVRRGIVLIGAELVGML